MRHASAVKQALISLRSFKQGQVQGGSAPELGQPLASTQAGESTESAALPRDILGAGG